MPLSSKGATLLALPQTVEVGRTPSEIVYREGRMKLAHYLPRTARRNPVPLLIVYALVNRAYILDLLPGRSVVEYFLDAGVDVYMVDWGVPDQADRLNTMADYITGYMHRCSQLIKERNDVPQVSLLGYCQGGTFSAIYTALHPEQVRNLVLLAAPIDFQAPGSLLNCWSQKDYFDVDKLVDAFGNIPPWVLNGAFAMLKPLQNTVDKYVRFAWSVQDDTVDDNTVEHFIAMERWLAEGIPHPGETFREFVKACYQDNRLIRNELRIDGRTVDLRRITQPVCNIVAAHDHIIPPPSTIAINQAIASQDKECIEFPSGHIGLSVGSRAAVELWPRVIKWLQARSQ